MGNKGGKDEAGEEETAGPSPDEPTRTDPRTQGMDDDAVADAMGENDKGRALDDDFIYLDDYEEPLSVASLYAQLCRAAYQGSKERAESILKNADTRTRIALLKYEDPDGCTPLHWACESSEQSNVVVYLLDCDDGHQEEGEEPYYPARDALTWTDKAGCTPLHRAAKAGNLKNVKYIIKCYKRWLAAQKDEEGKGQDEEPMRTAQEFVNMQNAADEGARTALHIAALEHRCEVGAVLNKEGGDNACKIKDTYGQTPVDYGLNVEAARKYMDQLALRAKRTQMKLDAKRKSKMKKSRCCW